MSPRSVSILLRLLLILYFPLLLLLGLGSFAFAAYLTYLAFTFSFFIVLLLPAVVLFGTVIHALAMLGRWGLRSPSRDPMEIRLPRGEKAGLIDFVQETARRRRLPAPWDI